MLESKKMTKHYEFSEPVEALHYHTKSWAKVSAETKVDVGTNADLAIMKFSGMADVTLGGINVFTSTPLVLSIHVARDRTWSWHGGAHLEYTGVDLKYEECGEYRELAKMQSAITAVQSSLLNMRGEGLKITSVGFEAHASQLRVVV